MFYRCLLSSPCSWQGLPQWQILMEQVPGAWECDFLESEPLLHPAGHSSDPDSSLCHPGGQRPPGDCVWKLLWGKLRSWSLLLRVRKTRLACSASGMTWCRGGSYRKPEPGWRVQAAPSVSPGKLRLCSWNPEILSVHVNKSRLKLSKVLVSHPVVHSPGGKGLHVHMEIYKMSRENPQGVSICHMHILSTVTHHCLAQNVLTISWLELHSGLKLSSNTWNTLRGIYFLQLKY